MGSVSGDWCSPLVSRCLVFLRNVSGTAYTQPYALHALCRPCTVAVLQYVVTTVVYAPQGTARRRPRIAFMIQKSSMSKSALPGNATRQHANTATHDIGQGSRRRGRSTDPRHSGAPRARSAPTSARRAAMTFSRAARSFSAPTMTEIFFSYTPKSVRPEK